MTSTIKVNNIQNQCGANIINESSNTITIGASGDTVSLASGASQTGFGRTGTVDWQTGSIKTATFTAVSGEGYFCKYNFWWIYKFTSSICWRYCINKRLCKTFAFK